MLPLLAYCPGGCQTKAICEAHHHMPENCCYEHFGRTLGSPNAIYVFSKYSYSFLFHDALCTLHKPSADIPLIPLSVGPTRSHRFSVMTVTPVSKERWSGCESVLCVRQDGSDDREKVEARDLAGAKRGVASRGEAWRYEARRGDTRRGDTKRYEANTIRGEARRCL